MALTIHYLIDAEPDMAVTPLIINERLMDLAKAERAGFEAAASQINTLAMTIFNSDHLRSLAA